jgi:hypothetical protein
MSASTPKPPAKNTSPAGDAEPERIYVEKLPLPGTAHAARAPQDTQNPLLQWLSILVVALLCLSLPGAAGAILVLLLIHGGAAGFYWLWIPMLVFVEAIAIACAIGIWREVTGWAGPRDYTR